MYCRTTVQNLIKDIKEGGRRSEGISFLDLKNRLLARFVCKYFTLMRSEIIQAVGSIKAVTVLHFHFGASFYFIIKVSSSLSQTVVISFTDVLKHFEVVLLLLLTHSLILLSKKNLNGKSLFILAEL